MLVQQIIDFGLSIGIPVDAHGMTYSLPPAGAVGKIFYMPPEVRLIRGLDYFQSDDLTNP